MRSLFDLCFSSWIISYRIYCLTNLPVIKLLWKTIFAFIKLVILVINQFYAFFHSNKHDRHILNCLICLFHCKQNFIRIGDFAHLFIEAFYVFQKLLNVKPNVFFLSLNLSVFSLLTLLTVFPSAFDLRLNQSFCCYYW